MKITVEKISTQVTDVLDAIPCLFNVPKSHRQMEPVENMSDGSPGCADNQTLQPDIPVTENGDVAAWHPSLGSKRGTNYIMLAGGDVRRARELTRWPALGHDTPHGDFEMAALISRNRANVGAIDKHGDW